ncbi:hypothetical protein F441_15357 [Phytophthora nicotianae CJ01A1]|uniref:Uncharacterized protein n=3 Tax=Phytophthora nicotianae TaxID=4792 RepID=W2R3X1_PHYN3|nr:hypothetical protein PPTG_21431 [Phytophthora nicotianae INRA-310]ETN19205.1 hypothetical protein PPTG_21431 [Phytophthora nicotianae INRA-310]ETO67561.1 hypothetical protein F444_15529 [Phytophthora nicotianae P1976]ETP08717.1 hypothetical protein F441_15357 [Phytophthora nicotianae CJ01A1]
MFFYRPLPASFCMSVTVLLTLSFSFLLRKRRSSKRMLLSVSHPKDRAIALVQQHSMGNAIRCIYLALAVFLAQNRTSFLKANTLLLSSVLERVPAQSGSSRTFA